MDLHGNRRSEPIDQKGAAWFPGIPAEFRGQAVPPVLVSGNHAQIKRWRRQQSLRVTQERRPDLLQQAALWVRLSRIF